MNRFVIGNKTRFVLENRSLLIFDRCWLLDRSLLASGTILYLSGEMTGIRLAFDTYDMDVYFSSARWITEGGRLYREVPSEYPLLANFIFAAFRYLANLVNPKMYAFYGYWNVSDWIVYL